MKIKFLFLISILLFSLTSFSQINSDGIEIDYSNPKEYEIGGISVSGIKYLDHNVVIGLSGLSVGDKINVPGEEITEAIKKLWEQKLFSDIQIQATKIVESTIFLDIYLQEKPRLSKFSFKGVTKAEADDIREKIKLTKGNQVTENLIINTKNIITNFFEDKGFMFTKVNIIQSDDSLLVNNVILKIIIDKGNRIKINKIEFEGNDKISDNKLKRYLKDTKEKKIYRIFKVSKYVDSNLKTDKQNILDKYNTQGFRDAKIIKDTIYKFDEKTVNLRFNIDEGNKYYFRNITWAGNTKHKTEILSSMLGINKGDIFDQNRLDTKLLIDETSVSSLYLDNGYLFFSATPVEILVENDSIDLEIRIYEGKQAIIDKVAIIGNTRTNDHVIRREIRTKPGELFNRSDIIRTQRELAQLGYFDPEKLNVTPTPNPEKGTVDLEYIVEEKPSDQIELSGGWGSGMIVGTLGLSFNNFSAKNIFQPSAYRPLPSGDGQRLSVRAQSNGTYYQAYNMSFVEPWLGGKKPNSFTISLYHTIQTDGKLASDATQTYIKISGAAIGLGTRLKWPDDFFLLYGEVGYQHYNLNQWSSFNLYSTGRSNNVSATISLSRNSIDRPIYPFKGSSFTVSVQFTPPYSAFADADYATMTDEDKYKWIEYHKWKFNSSWFTTLAGKLVLNTKAEFGFLGLYNRELGSSPFEGFNVGGDGLTGYNLYGRETIALRGYDNGSLTPDAGGNIYNKFTLELRYPLSLNPSATFYGLAFLEGGNAWSKFKDFNAFDIKRSAGLGVRIYLPMFGLLGVDWGYGFDDVANPNANKSQFHFIIGQQF
ncbi:MAG TPA: outer membrane protein assembly factor BamA [Bacteroidales bacterium]|nr:MAG: outer membrane protein assembly factor BamA [Bacteroidetes bacterium GWF2_33_38]OFY75295.1 MAG: outer membrane protein assembly factor BamA [Bacteroidetes bacterium RIFOXYA12_FULL_33_9]OFY88953.1 MAG: outer membrane protein assembly factor BamA [Bacteroidetes bacterium RIFOXYA2_FULL_33_7]HBF87806.1 outer membrane protein assembly factor BamA [Bacteroidales bacterium]